MSCPEDTDRLIDLNDLEDEFRNGEEAPEPSELDEVPDGTYQAVVEKAEVRVSQNQNRMLHWQLRVVAGPYAKRCVFHNNMLMTPENVKWLKADLRTAGLQLERLGDLIARAKDLAGMAFQIRVKTSGEFRNVRLLKRITLPPEVTGLPQNPPPSGQGTPTPAAPAPPTPPKPSFHNVPF